MKKSRNCSKKLLLLAIISSAAEAKDFSGYVSASMGESDNAAKSTTDLITERQESYEIGLSGDYDNSYIVATIDYAGTENRFAENSQQDQSFLEGRSMLQLGDFNDPMDVKIEHSRKTLLTSPDEINITNNQDEKEIISIVPRIKKRINDVDLLTGSIDFSDVDFLESNLNDSDRKTAELAWSRRSSKVNNINVRIQRADVEFKNVADANYIYTAAIATYATSLRKLDYSFALGYNNSERDNQKSVGQPTYTVNIAYNSAYNTLKLMANQSITDSSFGGGNSKSINQSPTSDGAFKVDQIKRRNSEFSWDNTFICSKCSMNISFHQGYDDYIVLPDEVRHYGGGVGLTYDLSQHSSIALGYNSSENKFVGALAGENYTLKAATVQYRYSFNIGVQLRLFIEDERRDSDDTEKSYDERFAGVSVGYYF